MPDKNEGYVANLFFLCTPAENCVHSLRLICFICKIISRLNCMFVLSFTVFSKYAHELIHIGAYSRTPLKKNMD